MREGSHARADPLGREIGHEGLAMFRGERGEEGIVTYCSNLACRNSANVAAKLEELGYEGGGTNTRH